MKLVYVLVEGETEERFCKQILAEHLPGGTVLKPILLGGVSSYGKIKDRLQRLLGNNAACCVTTMLDYYGLPGNFPGRQYVRKLSNASPYRKVAFLENAFKNDINNSRFLPFIMLHEFESLLLADPEKIVQEGHLRGFVARRFFKDIGNRPPEEVNDGPNSHPSALIKKYFPEFQKTVHGLRILSKIGLDTVRKRCPHFNGWIERLEHLIPSCL